MFVCQAESRRQNFCRIEFLETERKKEVLLYGGRYQKSITDKGDNGG
jgi:hypothetical protein